MNEFDSSNIRCHSALLSYICDTDKRILEIRTGRESKLCPMDEDIELYSIDIKPFIHDKDDIDFSAVVLPNMNFDVIVALGVIEHLNVTEKFIDELTNRCKKVLVVYTQARKENRNDSISEDILSQFNTNGFGLTKQILKIDECTILACFEKITSHKLKKQRKCTGCGSCKNICPVDAINLECDENGYLKPFVDEKKCIGCNKCVKTCPALYRPQNKYRYTEPKCYAARDEDEICLKSSSGGYFTALSRYVLNKGGCVYGAVWENDFRVGICRADSYDELSPMRLSKYVQSNTHYTFRDVLAQLESGRMVAYFGCPCQIAGLKNYIEINNSEYLKDQNLILIDLVCFYAPSTEIFRKYLEENFGLKNVISYIFRDKSKGWDSTKSKIIMNDGRMIALDLENDKYQKAFHDALLRNDVCETCIYYKFPRQGDFTIGDFWGIEKYDSSWNDGRGTNIVLVNSDKANTLFIEVAKNLSRVEKVPFSYSSNRINTNARLGHKNREYFMDMISKTSFNKSVDNALKGKHDIGLVCLCNLNSGNILTNYALYQTLSDMGYSVLLISNPENESMRNGVDERFIRFISNPYKQYDITPLVFKKEDLYAYNDSCDMFVVGSDQLFRAMFVEEIDYFPLLDWVSGTNYKMSYSTSFGSGEFEGDNKMRSKMEYLFERFQNISVREKSSVGLLKNVFHKNSVCVLDPVFLCDKSHYFELIKNGKGRLPKKKYIGGYILDPNENKDKIIDFISGRLTNGERVIVNDYYDKTNTLNKPYIEEWLSVVADSEFYITDSFHGACFAIIFEKQFAVVFNKDNWRGFERIRDILDRLGLESRYIDSDSNGEDIQRLIEEPIDYNNVNEKLNKEKYYSREWLINSLIEGNAFQGKYDFQDIIIEERQVLERVSQALDITSCKLNETKSELFISNRGGINENILPDKGDKLMMVVGFGAGACFKRNLDEIKKVYDLKYVCDNSPMKWGEELGDGVICISPKQLSEMADVLVVIMIDNVKTCFEIVDELKKLGINNYTHVENWLSSIRR